MATPVFCCGFECGVEAAHWNLNPLGGGGASFSTTTVRSGSRSLRINGAGITPDVRMTSGSAFTNTGLVVVRYYVRFATLPSESHFLNALYSGGTRYSAGAFFNQSDSKIYARSVSTNGATGVSVTTGVWYRIDARMNIAGNPWLTDVQVDGVACGQASHAMTGTSDASTVGLMGGITSTSTADIFFDDFWVSRTTADYPLGAGYVNHFVPTADGTHNIAGSADFRHSPASGGADILNSSTDAWTEVTNLPLEHDGFYINMLAPPSAANYVEVIIGPAPGISTPTSAPRAVEVLAGIFQAGTGAGNMELRLVDNGTQDAIYSATGVAGVTSTVFKRKHYATPPTGGAWTVTSGNGNFNGLLVRFGSPAAVDANPDQYWDSLLIEAEFAGDGTPPPGPSYSHRLMLLGVG